MLLKRVTLANFCGFAETFEVGIAPLTVLVGPNNGGKTTILMAIRFALEAFRLYFGGQDEPILERIRKHQWQTNLNPVSRLLGVKDFHQFYHGRSLFGLPKVELLFDMVPGNSDLRLSVECMNNGETLTINLSLNDAKCEENGREDTANAVKQLYQVQVELMPPLGTISPSEQQLSWPHLQEARAAGKYAETWRNHLQWLHETGSAEQHQRLAKVIREHIGDVNIQTPKRTRENPAHVIVEYKEGDRNYDISAAGGGLRTVVSLAAATELSSASLLLFDEPDAHLHATLQRRVAGLLMDHAGSGRQLIIATHSADFIDEVPVESLRWIDRKTKGEQECDDVGKLLVRLGAVTNTQAIQALGKDLIIYFEGKPDRTSLTPLMERCGKAALVQRARLAHLNGFGDIANLPGALRVLKTLLPMKVGVVAIRDPDYTQIDMKVNIEDAGDFLLLTLPCKELENLLLLSPKTIATAARNAAEARALAISEPPVFPTEDDIEKKIEEFTKVDEAREAIEDQWVFRWCEQQGGMRDPGVLTKARTEFEKCWADLAWRRRCCPGKLVLTKLKQWLQAEPYKVSLSHPQLFAALEPGSELQAMFDALEEYVIRVTS